MLCFDGERVGSPLLQTFLQVKNTATANTGAGEGEGLLVTRILLYLPRYKKGQIGL